MKRKINFEANVDYFHVGVKINLLEVNRGFFNIHYFKLKLFYPLINNSVIFFLIMTSMKVWYIILILI